MKMIEQDRIEQVQVKHQHIVFQYQKEYENQDVLVLLPTRELTMQVTMELNSILHKENEYRIYSIYGGTDLGNQIDQVRQGCEIVVGTPGRIQDLLQVVVLDEADQMLNYGFQENIERLCHILMKEKYKCYYSVQQYLIG
ncbi:unnamed protein product [Paramecium sonneborni]|uniref:Helicase ATP-binding domain-containing protein n=1 Tax=Paramecium sonneborni TaxID=65129 RepID=A0A8S1KFA6_9CILI|nr:unnamed protein product [Paramecium sonneborni]